MERSASHRHRSTVWSILGRKLPQAEVVFFTQVVLIYLVIVTCIINLSRGQGDSNLWTCLLSSSLGYLLPNPTPKRNVIDPPASPPSQDEPDAPHPPEQQLDEVLPGQHPGQLQDPPP